MPGYNLPEYSEEVESNDLSSSEEAASDEDMYEDPGDIRGDLGGLLDALGNSDFTGEFSFHGSYTDAPNPGMHVTGLGVVSLPLDQNGADRLKEHCERAPFGKGTQTVVDQSVRDTWEVDGSQVSFSNPAWDKYLKKVTKKACEALGIDFAASKPRRELYKLLLYETGSHFLPHVDTEKVDGMFATMIVVLPSKFSGGAVHLSHGGTSKAYDCASSSAFDTNVMAWYTDVTHEVKPVTSGYRLALSYNLIHTTKNLRPSLSANVAITDGIDALLKRWSLDDGLGSVDKVFYLLDHQYSQSNLSGSALKGADAHQAAVLSKIAAKYDVRIGLANATCQITGDCEIDEYDGAPDQYYTYGTSKTGPGMEMGEIQSDDVSLGNLVDLDGRLISSRLEYDDEEVFPEDVFSNIDDFMHYNDEEYEGYQGNYGGSINRVSSVHACDMAELEHTCLIAEMAKTSASQSRPQASA